MSRVNTPLLSNAAKSALEQGAKAGKTPCFCTRCEVILLKAMGLTSEEVAKFTAMTYVSVNAWTKRYKEEGIDGLKQRLDADAKQYWMWCLIRNPFYRL